MNHLSNFLAISTVSICSFVCHSLPCFAEDASLVVDLSEYEKRYYCQNREDGVIEKIFETIGSTSNYYVEFGVESGKQCNTRYMREKYGWNGLLMDGGAEDLSINLRSAFITAENINDLFAKYDVPNEFDLLSIDLDYNDFYVWKAINDNYRPRVVVIEYNATHGPKEDKVVTYKSTGGWDGTDYFGASLLAFYHLGRAKGYSLVYAEYSGVNCFFIRDDVLATCPHSFISVNDVDALYQPPRYGGGGHPKDSFKRPYLTSEEILKD